VTLNAFLSGVIYNSYIGTPLYQSARKIWNVWFHRPPKIWSRAKFISYSRDPDHVHSGVVCHPKASIWHILHMYKFCRSCFSRSGHDCGHRNRKWVMWPWPRPFLGRFDIHRLRFDTFCRCSKFDDSSFSHCRDIIGASKFKVDHVTLTTPLLRVICYQYAGTWHSLPVYKIWPL